MTTVLYSIKRDIQRTVGDARGPQPIIPNSAISASQRHFKQITEDQPPNKPIEAIIISESVKVNERDNRDSVYVEKELKYTMP